MRFALWTVACGPRRVDAACREGCGAVNLLKRFEDAPNGPNGSGHDGGRGGLNSRLNGAGQNTPVHGAPPSGSIGAPGRYGGAPEGGALAARTALAGGSALANSRDASFYDLKRKVQNALITELDPKLDLSATAQVRRTIEEHFNRILEQQGITLSRHDRNRLLGTSAAEILGMGAMERMRSDARVTELMVNGPKMVYVEQHARIYRTDVRFRADEHVMRVIDRIVSPLGRRVDEASPYVDARLPDGSRVNAVIPPLAIKGPTITIRKFSKDPSKADDLIRFGTLTPEMATFLKACVE